MEFTVYDELSGRVLRSGYSSHPEIQATTGESILLGFAAKDGYVDRGVVVSLGEKPSDSHFFNYTTRLWESDAKLAETSVRTKRDALLSASDWTQLPDVPLETKALWATYRQALRDITDQTGFPFDVVWPESPKGPAA